MPKKFCGAAGAVQKTIYISPEIWEEVVRESRLPTEGRKPGWQAGVIIANHFKNKEEAK